MSRFLFNSACNGVSPVASSKNEIVRSEQLSLLLRERNVPRFVVAPPGFGKTTLLKQYADNMFSFFNVCWIHGNSHCFYRDLDEGDVSAKLLDLFPTLKLLVIDDLPLCSCCERTEKFTALVYDLIDKGIEVLISCVPMSDIFAFMTDRLVCREEQLLINDTELLEIKKRMTPFLSDKQLDICRVPGLCVAEKEEIECFISNSITDAIPQTYRRVLMIMLLMGTGTYEHIRSLTSFKCDIKDFFSENYSFLHLDNYSETFNTPSFDIPELAKAAKQIIKEGENEPSFIGKERFIEYLSAELIKQGNAERSADIIFHLYNAPLRWQWLSRYGHEIISQGALHSFIVLYDSLGTIYSGKTGNIEILYLTVVLLFGEHLLVRKGVNSLAYLHGQSLSTAIFILLVSLLYKEESSCDQIFESLRTIQKDHFNSAEECGQEQYALKYFVELALHVITGISEGVNYWLHSCENEQNRQLLYYSSYYLMLFFGRRLENKDSLLQNVELQDSLLVFSRVFELIEEDDSSVLPYTAALSAIELSKLSRKMSLSMPDYSERHLMRIRQVEFDLFSQKSAFQSRRNPHSHGLQRTLLLNPAHEHNVFVPPLLKIKLFGSFGISLGGQPLYSKDFGRQKVRLLLALLVLNAGREYSRDTLVRAIWADNSIDQGRRNFYSTWSKLRKMLETSKGECPYLLRNQQSIKIDTSYIESDVDRFMALCSIMRNDHIESQNWFKIYDEVESGFSHGLLPGEYSNIELDNYRNLFDCRLFDSLLICASRLNKAGNHHEALQFARLARDRCPYREDACITLMISRSALGQRMEVHNDYRILKDHLETDFETLPSKEVEDVYEKAIKGAVL